MRNLSRPFMWTLALLLAAGFALGSLGLAVAGEEHSHDMSKMEKPKEVTLEGEVLDLYCFMNHPEDGQGPGHANCAKNCIKKGLPIGFLASDGQVYLLIGKEHNSAAPIVADYAGAKSRLKGMLVMHDGIKAIEVVSIEPLKS